MVCHTYKDLVVKTPSNEQDVDVLELPNAVSNYQLQAALESVSVFQEFERRHIPFMNHLFLSGFEYDYPIHVNTFSVENTKSGNIYCAKCINNGDLTYDIRDEGEADNFNILASCQKYNEYDFCAFLQNPKSYCSECDFTLIQAAGCRNCGFCNDKNPLHWQKFKSALAAFFEKTIDSHISWFPVAEFDEQEYPIPAPHILTRCYIPFVDIEFLNAVGYTYPLHINTFSLNWSSKSGNIGIRYCAKCLQNTHLFFDMRDFSIPDQITVSASCKRLNILEFLSFLQSQESYCNICDSILMISSGYDKCGFCDDSHPEDWGTFAVTIDNFFRGYYQSWIPDFPAELF